MVEQIVEKFHELGISDGEIMYLKTEFQRIIQVFQYSRYISVCYKIDVIKNLEMLKKFDVSSGISQNLLNMIQQLSLPSNFTSSACRVTASLRRCIISIFEMLLQELSSFNKIVSLEGKMNKIRSILNDLNGNTKFTLMIDTKIHIYCDTDQLPAEQQLWIENQIKAAGIIEDIEFSEKCNAPQLLNFKIETWDILTIG